MFVSQKCPILQQPFQKVQMFVAVFGKLSSSSYLYRGGFVFMNKKIIVGAHTRLM